MRIRRKINAGRAVVTICLFAMLSTGCGILGAGGPNPADYRQEDPSEYYLYLPQTYSADARWPVFVGIHGAGGSGLDCWYAWQPYADPEGFILLCPSLSESPNGWMQDTGNAKLIAILNRVFQEYPVYPQVYLAGFSAGGAFVQGFAFQYPGLVFGVSCIAPGVVHPPPYSASGIPFFVIVGERDDPRIVDGTRQLAEMLQAQGNPVEYHIIPGSGHELSATARELTISLYHSRVH
jgi:phospholipase/carboxylesterase